MRSSAGQDCSRSARPASSAGPTRPTVARPRLVPCSGNRCSCNNCGGSGASAVSCCSTSGRSSTTATASSSGRLASHASNSWLAGHHSSLRRNHHHQQQRKQRQDLRAQAAVSPFTELDAAFVTMGPTYPPFTVLKRSTVAGGILEEVSWAGQRRLRVWLPPGYSPQDACRHPYPVVFLNDGQNLFGDCTTLSGSSWQAGEVAAAAITAGQLPPFVMVGIDHAGPQRSYDYTPYVPGTGPNSFREDAASWPGGGVADYCDKVVREIVPWVAATYHTSQDPAHMAFGGSSLGGVAALYMGMRYPGAFGSLLVESPSLWVGEERFLQDIQRYDGAWPQRVWVGMGGREFSGVRSGKGEENDLLLVGYATTLARTLTQRGLGRDRLQWLVQDMATHTEAAWGERLPLALQFLGGAWWKFWEDRYSNELFFSVPRVMKAGMPAVIFLNRRMTKQLKELPASAGVNVVVGYNQFQHPVSLTLVPCPEVQTLDVPPATDALFAEVYDGLMQHGLTTAVLEWQREKERELRAARAAAAAAARKVSGNSTAGPTVWRTKARATTGWRKSQEQSGGDKNSISGSSKSSSSSSASAEVSATVKPLTSVFDSPEFYISNAATAVAVARDALSCQPEPQVGLKGDWWMVQLDWVPDEAYELNFVFSDAAEAVWENAGEEDFWRPVRPQYKLLLSSEIKEEKKEEKKDKEKGATAVKAQVKEKVLVEELVMAGGGRGGSSSSSSSGSSSSGVKSSSGGSSSKSSGSSSSGGSGGKGGSGKGGSSHIHSTSSTLSAAVAGLATAAAMAEPDKQAALQKDEVLFSMPAHLVAGAAACVYVNRRRLGEGLDEAGSVIAQVSFNKWQLDIHQLVLQPTALKSDNHHEWLCFYVQVPKEAYQMDLAFCNETQSIWDNNHGNNYKLPVASPAAAASFVFGAKDRLHVGDAKPDAAALAKRSPTREDLNIRTPRWRPSPRTVSFVKEVNHAGGRLTVLELSRRKAPRAGQPKRSHWWDERRIRVWTPESFKPDNAPPGGWPVLYMCDGENMFEDWLSRSGVSWRLGYKMSQLINANEVPPCVLVAVDSAGVYSPYNYLPYKPGTGVGGFRPEAKRWPGGGCQEYLGRLVEEVMPLVEERYNTSGDASRVAIGGGSFAGVTALLAGLKHPDIFGSVLAESPSLWIAEGAVLQDLADHQGRMPDRVHLGCGTREFSSMRSASNGDIDYLLSRYYHEAAQILRDKGLNSSSRLQFVVEEGAAHHEIAWQSRLGSALKFVCAPWWSA